jgi:hypothetical protein
LVELADALHLGVAEPKLAAQPRKIVTAAGKLPGADAAAQQIRSASDCRPGHEYREEYEQGPTHGLLPQGGRAYGIQVARFGQVVGAAGALGNAQRKADQKHGGSRRESPARAQEPRGQRIEPVCGRSLCPLNPAPNGILKSEREIGHETGLAQERT